VRRLPSVRGREAERRRQLVDHALAVVGDQRQVDTSLQLELLEPVAGRVPDPSQLAVRGVGHAVGERPLVDDPGVEVHVQRDDVGDARGQPQDARTSAAHDDRRPTGAVGARGAGEPGDAVVVARDRERLAGPAAAQDLDGLGQPGDPDAGSVERDAGRRVVVGHPPGPDPQLEPTA
jgi:hypothetical protein